MTAVREREVNWLAKRAALSVAAAGASWLAGGCVAFDVGRPETFPLEVAAGEETRTTGREVLFGQVVAETGGGAGAGETVPAEFSLHGLVDRVEQKGRKVNVVDVTRQKRLSFGLFPGTAEWIFRPEGWAMCYEDMTPSGMTHDLVSFRDEIHWGGTVHSQPMPVGCLPVFWILMGGSQACYTAALTPYFLFVEPFAGHWTCQGHACWMDWGGESGGNRRRGWPNRFWEAHGEGDFRKVERSMVHETWTSWAHCVPLGFFRHSFLKFSSECEGEWVPTGTARHVRETVAAKGPYRVEVSIPSLGFSDSRAAWRGAEKVRFELPRGAAPGEAMALVKFRAEGLAADESQRALLEDAARWTQVVPLWLPGPTGAAVRVVVEDARLRGAPLRYAKERDAGNGGASWVVEILDDSLEALDVAAFARPLILDELRAGWLERHPSEDPESVGAWADWRSGKNGRTLVFSGAAFSVRPVADGWRYDAASRRGEVRLRVPEGTDVEAARGWARENVESIAGDRAVVLGDGGAPPEGGRYRSLSERLDDGLLRIEFEVVQ